MISAAAFTGIGNRFVRADPWRTHRANFARPRRASRGGQPDCADAFAAPNFLLNEIGAAARFL
jgi:hypothetical protein